MEVDCAREPEVRSCECFHVVIVLLSFSGYGGLVMIIMAGNDGYGLGQIDSEEVCKN